MTLVAIHQPNLLPWLGYFDKLVRADIFIMLDDAQIQQTGGSWVNRCRVRYKDGPRWLTVPISRRGQSVQLIGDVNTASPDGPEPLVRSKIADYYRGFPHLGTLLQLIDEVPRSPAMRLALWNSRATSAIAQSLGLRVDHIVMASGLAVDLKGTARLVRLVQAVGGTSYLHGSGARAYQQDDLLLEAGIQPIAQTYREPELHAPGSWPHLAGLSVVDWLARFGPRTVGQLVRDGIAGPEG